MYLLEKVSIVTNAHPRSKKSYLILSGAFDGPSILSMRGFYNRLAQNYNGDSERPW